MEKWVCDVCGYIYDPEIGDPDNGIAAGTAFADLPEDWVCPLCGVGKDQFVNNNIKEVSHSETSFHFIVLCKKLTRYFLAC